MDVLIGSRVWEVLLRNVLCFWCITLLLGASSVRGQHLIRPVHFLKAAPYDAGTFVPPVSGPQKQPLARTAEIDVTYSGFTPEAREAFAFAVSIWEAHITSSVPIRIDARFEPLEEDFLGSSGPLLIAFDETDGVDGTLELGTWYATALASAVIGQDVSEGEVDVVASFNSDLESWYFGTDGNTPQGRYDFVTVVLHEIGHGLGISSSFRVDDGLFDSDNPDECGLGVADVGCWGYDFGNDDIAPPGLPLIYDRFVEDEPGRALVNTSSFANPSPLLADALQSEAVFFDSPSVRPVNRGNPVLLYAPSSFSAGSSISHLDEKTYPPGDPNSLMTPQLARREAIFSPGPITCGLLQDLGWPLGAGCSQIIFRDVLAFDVQAEGQDVSISFLLNADAFFAQVELERRFFDGPFESIAATLPLSNGFELTQVAAGRYVFRLRLVRADGSSVLGPEVSVFVELGAGIILSAVHPNPFRERAQLFLTVSERQQVRAEVYDLQGRRVASLFDGLVTTTERLRLSFEAVGLAPGVYFVHVTGQSFTATRRAMLVP